jgi:hypothetical protein
MISIKEQHALTPAHQLSIVREYEESKYVIGTFRGVPIYAYPTLEFKPAEKQMN